MSALNSTHCNTDSCRTLHHPAPPSIVRNCDLFVYFEFYLLSNYSAIPGLSLLLVSLKAFVKNLLDTQSDMEIRSPLSTFFVDLFRDLQKVCLRQDFTAAMLTLLR